MQSRARKEAVRCQVCILPTDGWPTSSEVEESNRAPIHPPPHGPSHQHNNRIDVERTNR